MMQIQVSVVFVAFAVLEAKLKHLVATERGETGGSLQTTREVLQPEGGLGQQLRGVEMGLM